MGSEEVPDSELYYLILDFLTRSTPCERAATALKEELLNHGLLGQSVNWKGVDHQTTPGEMAVRYSRLPRDQLPRVLSFALDKLRSQCPRPAPSLLGAVPRSEASLARSKEIRRLLIERMVELCDVTQRLRHVKALFVNQPGSLPGTGQAVAEEMAIEDQHHPPDNGAMNGYGDAVPSSVATREDEPIAMEVLDVSSDAEDTLEMQEASRGRVMRQLTERKYVLEEELKKLVSEGQKIGSIRSRERHEVCQTVADVVVRRELLGPRLPRRTVCHPGLYGRVNHMLTISGHSCYPVYCLKTDRRGQYIITGADDALIKIWSRRSGRLMYSLRGHGGVLTDMAVSPDNSMLASASEDRTIRIWSLKDGSPCAVLQGHTDSINYLNFHPVLNLIVTCSDDGTARLWDVEGVAPTNPDAVYNAPEAIPPPKVLPHKGNGDEKLRVKCISVCPLGQYFATGADDGVGRIWSIVRQEERLWGAEAPDGPPPESPREHIPDESVPMEGQEPPPPPVPSPVCLLEKHAKPMTDIEFSRRGDRIITASLMDGVVNIWSWDGGFANVCAITIKLHEAEATAASGGGGGHGGAGEATSEGAHDDSGPRRKGGGHPRGAHNLPPVVDNVIWSLDDQYVITSQSTRPMRDSVVPPPGKEWNQRLKIWNSTTGECIHSIRAHSEMTSLLLAHPTDERVIVSGGYDGCVFMWDIVKGTMLHSFPPNILNTDIIVPNYEYGKPVSLTDGQFFGDDGWGMALSDACGRFLIFGTGLAEEDYIGVETEQYFQNEFDPLQYDAYGNALDINHNVPPHLLTNHTLVDVNRRPYDQQPHYTKQGPCPFPEAEMEVKKANLREKAMEIHDELEQRRSNGGGRLSAGVVLQQFTATGGVGSLAKGRGAALPFRFNQRPARNAREPMRYGGDYICIGEEEEEEEYSSGETEYDSDGNVVFKQPTRRSSRLQGRGHQLGGGEGRERLLSREERARRREDIRGHVDHVHDGRRCVPARRAAKQKSYAESDDSDDGRRRKRRRRAGDEDYLEGEEESEDDHYDERDTFDVTVEATTMAPVGLEGAQAMPSNPFLSSPGIRREQVDRSTLKCAFCGLGDLPDFPLPGPEIGPHPLLLQGSAERRVWVHDDCAAFSPLVQNIREGFWHNISREILRGRRLKCTECGKNGATIGCSVERCQGNYHFKCAEATGWNFHTASTGLYCPKCRGRANKRARREQGARGGGGRHRDEAHKEEGAEWRPDGYDWGREWLSRVEPERYRYIPQVGDSVVFFPRAYATHLQQLDPGTLSTTNGSRSASELTFPAVRCTVTALDYRFTTSQEAYNLCQSIVCHVTLTTTGVPMPIAGSGGEGGGEGDDGGSNSQPWFSAFKDPEGSTDLPSSLEVRLREVDLPDFLVLEERFDMANKQKWQTGQRVKLLRPSRVGGETAIVEGTVDAIAAPGTEQLPPSPWNALHVVWDGEGGANHPACLSPWECVPMDEMEPWMADPGLEYEKINFLTLALTITITEPISEWFREAVPFEEYPRYNDLVPLPMDLGLVLARIKAGYYRQVEAVVRDLEQILVDCKLYNKRGAEIVDSCKEVVESALERVNRAKVTPNLNPSIRQLEKELAELLETLEKERLEEEMEKEATATSTRRNGRNRHGSKRATAGVKFHDDEWGSEEEDGDYDFADSEADEKPSALRARRSRNEAATAARDGKGSSRVLGCTVSGRAVVRPERYEAEVTPVQKAPDRPRRAAAARRRYRYGDEGSEEEEEGGELLRVCGVTRSGRVSKKPQKLVGDVGETHSSRSKPLPQVGGGGHAGTFPSQSSPGLFSPQRGPASGFSSRHASRSFKITLKGSANPPQPSPEPSRRNPIRSSQHSSPATRRSSRLQSNEEDDEEEGGEEDDEVEWRDAEEDAEEYEEHATGKQSSSVMASGYELEGARTPPPSQSRRGRSSASSRKCQTPALDEPPANVRAQVLPHVVLEVDNLDVYRHLDKNAGSDDELTWLMIKAKACNCEYKSLAAMQDDLESLIRHLRASHPGDSLLASQTAKILSEIPSLLRDTTRAVLSPGVTTRSARRH